MKSRLYIDGEHLTRQQYVWTILHRSEAAMTVRQILPIVAEVGIDALRLNQCVTRLLHRGNVRRDKGEGARYFRYTAIGTRPHDLRCRGFTPEQTANSNRARWAIDPSDDEAQNGCRGRGVSKADAHPPAIPSLADLLTPRQ